MANVSYELGKMFEEENTTQSSLPSFFGLKNDGDEAIVRFIQDDIKSFEIVTTHQIQTENGRFRNVNCLRDPREPLDKCPFCKAGLPVRQRFYIHMIQYDSSDDGMGNIKITPKPVVWERSFQYVERLKGYIDNYGPLSEIICKIIRHGKPGDMKTTYEIIPNLSKQIFSDQMYPKIEDAFKDYSAVGTTVLNKSAKELQYYIDYGKFPPKEEESSSQPIPAPTYNTNVQANNMAFGESAFSSNSFTSDIFSQSNEQQQNNQQTPGIQRPIRYY